jgi:hypothetical protein
VPPQEPTPEVKPSQDLILREPTPPKHADKEIQTANLEERQVKDFDFDFGRYRHRPKSPQMDEPLYYDDGSVLRINQNLQNLRRFRQNQKVTTLVPLQKDPRPFEEKETFELKMKMLIEKLNSNSVDQIM